MANKTKLWYLQNFNFFETMKPSDMMDLENNTSMKAEKKKEIIYFPEEASDTIYFLKEGKVKISKILDDGRSTVMQILGPGEIFGESSLLGGEQHENIAEVIEDAIICTIDKDIFTGMMMKNPGLTLKITRFIGWRLRHIENHVEDLVFKDAKQRIVSFLIRYIENYGKKMVDGWMVRPFISQQDIADLTAVSRQTASQTLNELKNIGLINFTRRFLSTSKLDKLREISGD